MWADDIAKILLPAGVTTQESTIGQTIKVGDPRQYGGAKIEKSPGLQVLADFRGLSLYTFDSDVAPGKSACTGACLAMWPAFAAPLMAIPVGDWSVIVRDDGTRQWAYKGKPLHTYVKDAKAGDTRGEGAAKLWHVARP